MSALRGPPVLPNCLLALALWCVACAGELTARPAALPGDQAARKAAAADLATRIFAAMQAGTPQVLLVPERTLDELVRAEARPRFAQERAHLRSGALDWRAAPWASAHYVGFCAQEAARLAHSGGPLREEGWVLSRLLVVADDGGGRSALWTEGTFVYTERGFEVISLRSVERVRRGHSDLDLAPCDVEDGIR